MTQTQLKAGGHGRKCVRLTTHAVSAHICVCKRHCRSLLPVLMLCVIHMHARHDLRDWCLEWCGRSREESGLRAGFFAFWVGLLGFGFSVVLWDFFPGMCLPVALGCLCVARCYVRLLAARCGAVLAVCCACGASCARCYVYLPPCLSPCITCMLGHEHKHVYCNPTKSRYHTLLVSWGDNPRNSGLLLATNRHCGVSI